jgi:hypothetical protein
MAEGEVRHVLKVQPPGFDALLEGKSFEVRRNDRGFQKGDVLELREWLPESGPFLTPHYSDRAMVREVNYVFSGGFGCEMGDFVVLGLAPAPEELA